MLLLKNAFTENLTDTEFVAVNPAGVPIGRASSRESLERAHPDGSATILSAAEINAAEPTLAEAATAKLDGPFAAVVAQGVAPEIAEKPALVVVDDPVVAPEGTPVAPSPPGKPFKEPVQVDPLDHDADGKKGGHKLNADKVAIDKKTKASK